MKTIQPSELIINNDGSIFHLHLKPEQLADNIILVGDPERVNRVTKHFDSIECEVINREFHSTTGRFMDKRITVISTGIGCDNIDIVMNEIDALANIDFSSRTIKPQLKSLNIVRIGTCGGLQPDCAIGSFIASEISIGFDGLLNFYAGRNDVCDLEVEKEFINHMNWKDSQCIAFPYVIHANSELTERISQTDMIRGITIACGGFYGPQGRVIRLPLADPLQNEKIISFRYQSRAVTNFEMESSAIAGLSALMGHKALTVCMVIANRVAHKANTSYKNSIDTLILKVLERI